MEQSSKPVPDNETLITVAIHTTAHALELKSLLEHEGVSVWLQNVNLQQPVVAAGVRVRIRQRDLPLALRIIENTEVFTGAAENVENDKSRFVLVPVDASQYSLKAAMAAFSLASCHEASVVLLHSYIDPYDASSMQLSDALTFDRAAESEARRQVEIAAQHELDNFAARLRKLIAEQKLPPVKFRTEVLEGVPEDAIVAYAKLNPPFLTVMGTRGARRKEEELIGSVTAEVIDKCRSSVLTIPEPYEGLDADGTLTPRNILFFTSLEQEDILALDTMARLFPRGGANVTIVHVAGKRCYFAGDDSGSMRSLLDYCHKTFTGFTFSNEHLRLDPTFEDISQLARRLDINLIVVPNKRKNIFARLINRGLPNRILYSADIPMLVIRV